MARGGFHRGFAVHARALSWGLVFALPATAAAQTVGDYVGDDGCSSAVVRGLADQLVDQLNCLYPGTLATFEEGGQIAFASRAVIPALQTEAVPALFDALAERPGSTITITSALRALPQQYLLYQWYRQGRCGIQIAASPGTSPHESAKGLDVSDYDAWQTALESHDWDWYGSGDRVHYTFTGAVVDIRSASVMAFQTLWNANHPDDLIGEDGDYGPETESHLALAPAGGFAIPTTCRACEQGRHVRFDGAEAPAEVRVGETVDVMATFTNSGDATWVSGQVFLATEPPVPLDHDVIEGGTATFLLSLTPGVAGPMTLPLRLVDAADAPLEAGCEGAAEGTASLTVVEPAGQDPDDDGSVPGSDGDGTGLGDGDGDELGDPRYDGPDGSDRRHRRLGGLTGCAAGAGGPRGGAGSAVLAVALLAQYAARRRRSSTR
jgi:hypothetical protein